MSHTSTHTTHTHQHTPPLARCPEPIQAVMHEEAFHLHAYSASHLDYQTTVSLYRTARYKAPLLMPLAGRNSAAQECAPE